MPPLRGFRNRGYNSLGSMSSLDSASTENSNTGVLRPSSFYNKELNERQRERDREENMRKIEDLNRELGAQPRKKEQERKGLFGFPNFEKFRTSFRGSTKNDAIRDWEQRQEKKRTEKGLFATMDSKGYGSNTGSFEGWGKNKTKETVRTVYVPIRVNSNPQSVSRPVSRASTDLPPYKERYELQEQEASETNRKNKKEGIYPKCPSPDTDDEIEKAKLKSWIEYTENLEMSVDKPTYLQRNRNSTAGSSLAMGTLFEGYGEDDSFVESDEINIIPSCSEYDGDWDSLDEHDNRDSDLGEAEEAMRLTRPFNKRLKKKQPKDNTVPSRI